jgi:hypothetical protein
VAGKSSINGTNYAGFKGAFMFPVISPKNTSSSLTAALTPVLVSISSTYLDQFLISILNVTIWPTLYDFWLIINRRADALRDTDALETA